MKGRLAVVWGKKGGMVESEMAVPWKTTQHGDGMVYILLYWY